MFFENQQNKQNQPYLENQQNRQNHFIFNSDSSQNAISKIMSFLTLTQIKID